MRSGDPTFVSSCSNINLQGIHNFAILRDIFAEMRNWNVAGLCDIFVELVDMIEEYYKRSFRKELRLSSHIASLCLTHCLSDPNASDLKSDCSHDHLQGDETEGYIGTNQGLRWKEVLTSTSFLQVYASVCTERSIRGSDSGVDERRAVAHRKGGFGGPQ